MVIETRALIFDQIELMQAAHAYCLRTGVEMPPGEMRTAKVGDEAAAIVRFRFDAAADGPGEITLSFHQMAAALIMHCRTVGIPVPRYARKRLEPIGDGIVMKIRLAENAGEAQEAPPEEDEALPAA